MPTVSVFIYLNVCMCVSVSFAAFVMNQLVNKEERIWFFLGKFPTMYEFNLTVCMFLFYRKWDQVSGKENILQMADDIE